MEAGLRSHRGGKGLDMSPDLKREIKNGQDLAALAFLFTWGALAYNDVQTALYWQERQRRHAARARSMMGIFQEDCHD